MNWKILTVCLLIATSGCIVPEPFAPSTDVKYSGEMEITDGQFLMDGEVIQRSGENTLTEVAICGYTEQMDHLFAEQVPPFESRQSVEITGNQTPKYVIIYSEEFWTSGYISKDAVDYVQYYVLGEDGLYGSVWAGSTDELPVDTDRPLENGCPA